MIYAKPQEYDRLRTSSIAFLNMSFFTLSTEVHMGDISPSASDVSSEVRLEFGEGLWWGRAHAAPRCITGLRAFATSGDLEEPVRPEIGAYHLLAGFLIEE